MEAPLRPVSSFTQQAHKSRLPHRLLLILPWLLLAGLAASNLMTLLSPSIFLEGRQVLTPLLQAVTGHAPDQLVVVSRERLRSLVASEAGKALTAQRIRSAAQQKVWETTVEVLQRKADELQALKLQADTRFGRLQSEHVHLQATKNTLDKEHEALRAASSRRAYAVQRVVERVTKRMAVHAGEAIAELPIRAAPYVGATALVVGTSLDIQSDCKTARDLKGLVIEYQEPPIDTGLVCRYVSKIPSASQVWRQVESRANTLMKPLYRAIEQNSAR
jgi:hypothetical protein